MRIKKLAIAVTFHYAETRLKYLEKISTQFHLLADEVLVHVFTNVNDEDKKYRILNAVNQSPKLQLEIHTPTYLGHPYLLTWCHFYIFRKLFYEGDTITHFMYLEDDIFITPLNISYWLKARDELKSKKFIPAFIRYEQIKNSTVLYSTDSTHRLRFYKLPRIKGHGDYCYLNLPCPYQGMYLLDRELMEDHLNGSSSTPGDAPWGIREKAATGPIFNNVPKGFWSRNLIRYNLKDKGIDQGSLIHHLPNNYAEKLDTLHGKIIVNELIISSNFYIQLVLSPLSMKIRQLRSNLFTWLRDFIGR
jgi:hypothetical protein